MEQELADTVKAHAEALEGAIRDAQGAGLVVMVDVLTTSVLGGDLFHSIVVQIMKPLAASGNKAPMAVEL